ncbi:MAG: endonuclease/exonuclease/phosphatase family protein [Planctomycetota bacterium]
MIIATWNSCGGTVDSRSTELQSFSSFDILALQEVQKPENCLEGVYWNGASELKGVAVCTQYPSQQVVFDDSITPFLAVRILESPLGPFNLLAVCAKRQPSYCKDLIRTFDQCEDFLKESPCVILGDFNATARLQNTTKQFDELQDHLHRKLKLVSAYHQFKKQTFGMESFTTLYFRWGTAGCFHIDYVYIPQNWISYLNSVTIPGFKTLTTSDHRPVVVELTSKDFC